MVFLRKAPGLILISLFAVFTEVTLAYVSDMTYSQKKNTI